MPVAGNRNSMELSNVSTSEPPSADAAMIAALEAANNEVLDYDVMERDCCDEIIACMHRLRDIRDRRMAAVEKLERLVTLCGDGAV